MRFAVVTKRKGKQLETDWQEAINPAELASLSDLQILRGLDQIDAYLGTLGSGRTIVEASEVRDLLLDIRTILKGTNNG